MTNDGFIIIDDDNNENFADSYSYEIYALKVVNIKPGISYINPDVITFKTTIILRETSGMNKYNQMITSDSRPDDAYYPPDTLRKYIDKSIELYIREKMNDKRYDMDGTVMYNIGGFLNSYPEFKIKII